MPLKTTKRKAAGAKRAGKAPTTQAGAYVGEQLHKAKHGRGRAKSRKQAVAIGLAQARRADVKVAKKGSSRTKGASKRGNPAGRRTARKIPG